jgi:DNA-binding response OmpR family regulator
LGQDYCRQIRDESKTVPLLVLSAISDVANVIQLLQLGADDYITKPFDVPEFLARVRASMRLWRLLKVI